VHETVTDAYVISGRGLMKTDCNALLTDWK